jgi:predicted tellurium resistance membrane protein TerC
MTDLLTPENIISLLTLTAMEIVLGIDNIVFLAILSQKLPPEQQAKARRVGLILALGMRLGLLLGIKWIMGLTAPLFSVWKWEFSGRDLVLLLGGLFLLGKATHEIYDKLEAGHSDEGSSRGRASFFGVIVQILLLDLVFSLDSVITAVGMVPHVEIMVVAMVVAVGVMLVSAGKISGFIERHPSMKILALSFLLLIGVLLSAEAFDQHIPKGYVYFAMAFSLGIELLNMRFRRKRQPVHLHHRFESPTVPERTHQTRG